MSKTLLQLLVENLKEWSEGTELVVQDCDKTVGFATHETGLSFNKHFGWWLGSGWGEGQFHLPELASDYSTAIVTKAEWIKAKQSVTLANDCIETRSDISEYWAKQLFFSMYMESEEHWNMLTEDERNKYYKAIDAGWRLKG